MIISSTELIDQIAEETGVEKKAVKNVIKAFWPTIKKNIEADNEVRFIGYGKFYKKHTPARKGFNPQTKEPIDIAASERLAFKSALKLG